MQKRIDVLEEIIRKLSDKTEAEARSLQKAAEAGTAANAERCSRLDEQQAALASKSMVELVRQEVSKLERAQAVLAEESRSKAYAQDMLLQGLESRIEATERAQRAVDAKYSGELASLSGRVQQMNATVERMRADFEARLSEGHGAKDRLCPHFSGSCKPCGTCPSVLSPVLSPSLAPTEYIGPAVFLDLSALV
eukprot:1457759-Pleurochrysis_carterae.AAC.2